MSLRLFALSTVFDEVLGVVLSGRKPLGPETSCCMYELWRLVCWPCRGREFPLAACPVLIHSLLVFVSHFQLTGLFQFTVRLASETEARFTSVERINHYIKVRLLQPLWSWMAVMEGG